MISKIIVPKKFLEEIREEGIKEARRNKEATGFLLGLYDEREKSVTVSEKYRLPHQIGDGGLCDILTRILTIPKIVCIYGRASHFNKLAVRKIGKIPAEIAYHTHPYGSWSKSDLWSASLNSRSVYRVVEANLLYTAKIDIFLAIDADKKDIPIVSK